MSSRNPLGDTSRGSTDDRNATGGGTSGGTSGGASGGGSVGDDRNTVADSGGRDRDDDDDDPRNPLGDTSRGSTDDRRQTSGGGGGGDRGVVERATSRLDDLGESYTQNVAEPVGDAVAATNPAARLEQEALGTDRLARLSEGVGEGVAQLGNAPAIAAGTIDAAQTLDESRSRARDPVTIGGVPTGATVPDPEGQRENTAAAAGAAGQAAAAAARNPFKTSGQVVGSALGGVAASRGIARVARGSSTSSGVDADPVPSGRSNPGTEGVGSVLDPDDIGTTNLRDTGVDVDDTVSTSTRTADTDSGSLPLEDAVSDAGGVRTMLDRQRAGLDDFLGDDRAQAGLGRQRSRGSDRGTDRGAPDTDAGIFEDVRQDALTQIQDDLAGRARRPDPGDFDPDGDPLGGAGGARRGTIDPDTGEVSLGRSRGPTGTTAVDDATATGAAPTSPADILGAGAAAGLGSIAETTDPTGIAPTSGTDTGARIGDDRIGVADSGLGSVAGTNDPTDIAPDTEPDTGTLLGGASATDTQQEILELQRIRAETDLRGALETAQRTTTDTAQRTGIRTVSEPTTDTGTRVGSSTRTGGTGFGGARLGNLQRSATPPRAPRPRTPPEVGAESDDDEVPLFGTETDADLFDSGILSAEDVLGR
jgi:hypothetical protein